MTGGINYLQIKNLKQPQSELSQIWIEDVSLVQFTYLVFTHMPGESYSRRLRSLLLYLCYVFRALNNSLVCWFFKSSQSRERTHSFESSRERLPLYIHITYYIQITKYVQITYSVQITYYVRTVFSYVLWSWQTAFLQRQLGLLCIKAAVTPHSVRSV